jgi:hypothetical protein
MTADFQMATPMSRRELRQDPHDVLAARVGSWFLSRSIDNGASMVGTAIIAARGNGQFDYHEQGQLRLPDNRMIEGERRYIFEEETGGFMVLFAESPPRLFHRITLSSVGLSLVGSAIHFCAEDRYDSRYEFRGDGSFVVEHAIRGPRKRYTINTRYSRDADRI